MDVDQVKLVRCSSALERSARGVMSPSQALFDVFSQLRIDTPLLRAKLGHSYTPPPILSAYATKLLHEAAIN